MNDSDVSHPNQTEQIKRLFTSAGCNFLVIISIVFLISCSILSSFFQFSHNMSSGLTRIPCVSSAILIMSFYRFVFKNLSLNSV
jgi:hypothetical protein